MRRLLNRVAYLFGQAKRQRELDEELEAHRAMAQERLEASGVSREEARYASRRVLGNMTLAREDARAIWIAPWLESIWQDAAYAFRTFARQPGFAIVAVGALAAGIGLNTSIFTVFSALTIREWPVRDPHQVVKIINMSPRDIRSRGGGGPGGFSLDEVRYFSAHSKTLGGFVVTRVGGGDKTIGDENVPASWVSGNYFAVLGVEMAHGRGFLVDEDRTETPAAVAVLSYGYWQRQFGGDPFIVGKQVRLEDVPFTIVGVTARSFTGTLPEPIDIWMPLGSSALLRPDDRYVTNVVLTPANCCSAVAGRLVDGVTREQAEAELTVLDRAYRHGRDPEAGVRLTGTPFSADPKGDMSRVFAPMFAGAMLVLLIACANVANLLVARAVSRRREIGVRLSIGASRARVIRQLLTESLVLAIVSGAAGLWIALWLPAQLIQWTGVQPGALQLSPDARILGFTILISVVSSLVFGLVPAFHGAKSGVIGATKDVRVHRSRVPLRGVLLSLQVGVAVVLLVAAALIANAVRRISAKDLGFTGEGVAVVTVEPPARGFDPARTRTVTLQIADALLRRPNVVLTSTSPLGSGNIKGAFTVPGNPEDQFNSVYEVSPGYFEFLHIPIVAGRPIEIQDADRPVIVINESMARTFWKSPAAAIGRHIVSEAGPGGYNRPGDLEIVGVVRDVHAMSLTTVDHTIYQPLSGRGLPQVLTSDDPEARDSVRKAAESIEPRLRVRTASLSANLEPLVRGSRTAAMLAGAMGTLALTLAAIGIFAVFACWVQQRTHEIGVRMALGARATQIVWLLLSSSMMSIAIGALAGLAGAAAVSRVLQSYMFGLSAADPLAYGSVILVVTAVGALATCWPARRAVRVDPVHALRYE